LLPEQPAIQNIQNHVIIRKVTNHIRTGVRRPDMIVGKINVTSETFRINEPQK